MPERQQAPSRTTTTTPRDDESNLPGGYRLVVKPDLSYEIVNKDGKVLSSVPDKVRKTSLWKQWMEVRKNHRTRLRENTFKIVDWMVSRQVVDGRLLASLLRDPAWKLPLTGLVVRSAKGSGFITGGDPEKGVGIFTQHLDNLWLKEDEWIIPHPADLSELAAWQQCASENSQSQGTAQLLRPVHRPASREETARYTARFSDKELENAARSSHALNRKGWATSSGTASREFVVYTGGEPQRVTAHFEYFKDGEYYGDWNVECHTGNLYFTTPGEDEGMQLRDVPPAVFSEACLVAESIVAAG